MSNLVTMLLLVPSVIAGLTRNPCPPLTAAKAWTPDRVRGDSLCEITSDAATS